MLVLAIYNYYGCYIFYGIIVDVVFVCFNLKFNCTDTDFSIQRMKEARLIYIIFRLQFPLLLLYEDLRLVLR